MQDWLNSVSSKQASYHALAQYYQSMVSKESKEFGEEIARLKVGHLLTLLVALCFEEDKQDMCCQYLHFKTNKQHNNVSKFVLLV